MSKAWLSNNAITLAGAAAVLCGLLFLSLTGAPPRLLLINLVALSAGIALLAIARLLPVPSLRPLLLLGAAAATLATALFGVTAEGAARWVMVGGLSLQPSLILLPALLLAHVTRPDRWSSLAIALAALAMALQPDRSLAAAIALVTLTDAACRRTPTAWLTTAAPLLAFAVTAIRPDDLPAVAHVDQILWTSVVDQPLAALAIWTGTLLLFVPALVLWRRGLVTEAAGFTTLWACLVAAAMLHNYPTPLVGYGASSILGYLLVALTLPLGRQSADPQTNPSVAAFDDTLGIWRVAATVR
ncbi:hypothetical protein V6R86_02240 [Sphingomonas kaistensis]|uniref:Peptidoglycan polymerase n=1 Tax=Sphingomonas kaistensis TaxID=298708 RepID=A0ABZ2G143_9SPHN